MLYTKEEQEIMAQAEQPGMRIPTRVPPFRCILADFFGGMNMQGQTILDIGPGQCDFLDLAAKRGAKTYGIDRDPAVIRLGTLRGHTMTYVPSFQQEWPFAPSSFDGLFCRGSLNYFSASTHRPTAVASFLDTILSTAKPDAWIWIVPWLRPGDTAPPDVVEGTLLAADIILKRHNIRKTGYTAADITRYAINYEVPFPQMWTRGLPPA